MYEFLAYLYDSSITNHHSSLSLPMTVNTHHNNDNGIKPTDCVQTFLQPYSLMYIYSACQHQRQHHFTSIPLQITCTTLSTIRPFQIKMLTQFVGTSFLDWKYLTADFIQDTGSRTGTIHLISGCRYFLYDVALYCA